MSYILVNIGSGTGMLTDNAKPLPSLMSTYFVRLESCVKWANEFNNAPEDRRQY